MKYGLYEETLEELQDVFRKHAEIEQVILYGSRALGTYRLGSDIDLALIAPTYHTKELLQIEIELDDLLLPYKIDLSLLHHIDNAALLDHIDRIGQVFFHRD